MNNLGVEGIQNRPNELLERDEHERLYFWATETAIRANPAMEAVEALDGAENVRG